MQRMDFILLLPLILVAVASVVLLLGIAIRRSHLLSMLITLVGLAGALGTLWVDHPAAPQQITPLLVLDGYGRFFIGLMLATSICVTLFAYGYLKRQNERKEEFYVLLLLATLGAAVLVVSNHFASFFLALELLSVSLYALNAYARVRPLPVEAGIKYLILAASSAAFLLFGMALLYSQTGTMSLNGIAAAVTHSTGISKTFVSAGLALLVTGIGFKLGVVPFHLWTPDIYEGAPAPVTAWVATASKGSMFALLVRYFYGSWAQHWAGAYVMFSVIAIASMLGGNLLALMQRNVKRILAYSSIAHLGYLLVAFQASGEFAVEAVSFYLVAYFVTTLGAFGVISALSYSAERDADSIEDYRGLFQRRPGICLIFTAMLLSLAGIPLTAGFIGKFYIVAAGASGGIWALLIILVVSSAIGLFYYLRIVMALYEPVSPAGAAAAVESPFVSPVTPVLLCLLTALLIWFGVYPQQLLALIHSATSNSGVAAFLH